MYERHPREPLNFLLHKDLPTYQFRPRLAEMTDALKTARIQTEATRTWNRNPISKKANAGLVHVGDTVVLKVPEPVTFSSQWEPCYEVIRVKGTTCVLRHQLTGQTKSVHPEKIRIVDPNINWDNIQPRPTWYNRKQMPTPPTPSSDYPTPQLINTTPPPPHTWMTSIHLIPYWLMNLGSTLAHIKNQLKHTLVHVLLQLQSQLPLQKGVTPKVPKPFLSILLVYIMIQKCHATSGLHMTVNRVYEGIKVHSHGPMFTIDGNWTSAVYLEQPSIHSSSVLGITGLDSQL